MDLSQTLRPSQSTFSECENDAANSLNFNLPSQKFIDTYTIKVEQDVSDSSPEQLRNDDTNLHEDIKLEPQFCIVYENDFIDEENHRAAGCDVRIKTEPDESCSNLHHVSIDNEILQNEDQLQNDLTSELMIKSEHEWSDVEESRDNVHDISDDTERQAGSEIGRQVDTGHLKCAVAKVTSFPCQICGCVLKRKPYLIKHLKLHQNNDKGPFECKVCNKKFNKKVGISLHAKVHLNPHKCKYCGKCLMGKEELHQHIIQDHQAVCSLFCIQCSKSFKTKTHLKIHDQRFHSDVKAFKCDICSKSFKTNFELNKHNKAHSDVRPFACNKCGASFKYNNNLLRHIRRVHTELRPIECEVCAKRFKSKDEIRIHIHIHTMKRKFKCVQCKKKFKTQTYLSQHMKRHSSLKSFQCAQCNKGFKTKQEVSTHMTVHSDMRPFSCDICAKSFKTKLNLKNHGLVMHSSSYDVKCNLYDASPFQCNECDESLKTKSALKHHMIRHLNLYQF